MKKPVLMLGMAFLSMFLFLRFSIPEENASAMNITSTEKFSIPDDIQPIIKKSCWGCHNSQSKNEKAKGKLQFDQLEHMKKKELGGILGKINEEISKGDMPPPKFLEKFEKAKLTDQEKDKLVSWSADQSSKYMKKKKNKKKDKEASM
jgi:hypothetical protein